MTLAELSDLDNYFVAYIDILGFSQMVLNDFENSTNMGKNINKLYMVHKKTAELTRSQNVELLQFSDSIVLAIKFDKSKFKYFINIIAKYQYDLLCQGILCRGGVAYGRHFFHDGFMYSVGLIEAYKIENSIAINPKIVVSPDLFSLLYPSNIIDNDIAILKEDDGTNFIDYIKYYEEKDSEIIDHLLIFKGQTQDAKMLSKYRWLSNYIEYKIPSKSSGFRKFSTLY